jgi:fluoroquinolone resistance protein
VAATWSSPIWLPGCDLHASRFREADLSAADLSDADLHEADLFQANLGDARLDGADLRDAEISGLDLRVLASYAGLKVNQGQQHILLVGLGIDVHPDERR